MNLFSPLKTGLHIGKEDLSLAVLKPKKGGFEIQDSEVIPLSKNSVRHSPIERNLLNVEEIRGHLGKIFSDYPKIKSVSLSLPDLASRMILIEVKNRIPPLNELNQMIKWNMEQKFITKIGDSRFSHQLISRSDRSIKKENGGNGAKRYFYLLGSAILKNILAEYENLPVGFHRLPKMMNSASLNLFNLYHDLVFKKGGSGNFLFLSVLDHYFTLMVFEKGILHYIRTVGFRLLENGEEGGDEVEEGNRLKMVNHIESVIPYHYRDLHARSEIVLFLTGLPDVPKAVLDLGEAYKMTVSLLRPGMLPALEGIGPISDRESVKLSPAIAAAAGALN